MGKDDYKKTMQDQFDEWLDEYEHTHGERPTHLEIAKKVFMTPASLSRKIREKSEFTAREIKALADFFDISCDSFISGIPIDNQFSEEAHGLNQGALEWLKKTNKTEPKLTSALDMILENEYIAHTLLSMFLVYVESPMLKMTHLAETDPNEFIYLNTATGERIIKDLLKWCFDQILDDFKHDWEKRISNTQRLHIPKKLIEKMKKHVDEESGRRMRKKYISKQILPMPIQQYRDLVDEIARYRIFKNLIEKGPMHGRKEETQKS